MKEFIKSITPQLALSDNEINNIIRKYKYNPSDEKLIRGVYYSLDAVIRPKIVYSCVLNQELIKLDKSLSKRLGSDLCELIIKNSVVLATVTLGNYVDMLQNVYENAEEVLINNIINNICMELLMKAYSVVAGNIAEESGLWANKYIFPGDKELDVSCSKDIIEFLKINDMSYNDAYVLSPSKSVTMAILLSNMNKKNERMCANCSNIKCIYREID